jgi:hypothetical protein
LHARAVKHRAPQASIHTMLWRGCGTLMARQRARGALTRCHAARRVAARDAVADVEIAIAGHGAEFVPDADIPARLLVARRFVAVGDAAIDAAVAAAERKDGRHGARIPRLRARSFALSRRVAMT